MNFLNKEQLEKLSVDKIREVFKKDIGDQITDGYYQFIDVTLENMLKYPKAKVMTTQSYGGFGNINISLKVKINFNKAQLINQYLEAAVKIWGKK